MPTLEEVHAAEAAAQKKKDDEMTKYLTIPPEGKAPNSIEPGTPMPEKVESDEDRQKRAEAERKENMAMRGAGQPNPAIQGGAKKPVEDDDDDDDKPKHYNAPKSPQRR